MPIALAATAVVAMMVLLLLSNADKALGASRPQAGRRSGAGPSHRGGADRPEG